MSECFNPLCPQPHNSDLAQQCQSCGWSLSLLGQYYAKQLIGQGGFGRTFLAAKGSLAQHCLCVIKQAWLDHSPAARLRSPQVFQQEAERLALLGHHPQIPALIDHFEENGYFYLVQEWIDGPNLAELLAQQGVLSENQIWQLLSDLLPVLQFIHAHHIIHRDIKPANLIRRRTDGCLVLVDFGAAKLVEGERWEQGTSIGSAEYVAPEQAKGKATFASDLYSLGVTCIHLLTDLPPFELFDTTNDGWIWRSYLTQPVSDRLAQLLDKLLQSALSRRYQTAGEVMAIVQAAQRSQSFVVAPVAPASAPKTNRLWQFQQTLTDNLSPLKSVHAVAFSPTGQWLASGSDDKIVRLWDLETSKLIQHFTAHTHAVQSIAFSPTGQWLASGSDDKTVRLWDLETGKLVQLLAGHSHAVKSVAFSSDGQLLASGSWDKTIRLWDVATSTYIATLKHGLQVTAVAFSWQANWLASASCDRTIRLWSRANHPDQGWILSSTFRGHAWPVFAIAFSPDDQLLATGGDDRTIKLWQVTTGQLLRMIDGHSWSVSTLAFSPDGKTLVSGSWDQTIKLWEVSTGQLLDTLSAHQDSVHTLAINNLGTTIASGSKDQTIKLWQRV